MATKTGVLRQTWGQVPAMSVVSKTRYFSKEVGLFPAKSGYFSQNSRTVFMATKTGVSRRPQNIDCGDQPLPNHDVS